MSGAELREDEAERSLWFGGSPVEGDELGTALGDVTGAMGTGWDVALSVCILVGFIP